MSTQHCRGVRPWAVEKKLSISACVAVAGADPKVNSPQLVALVRAGVKFENGIMIESGEVAA